MVQRALFSSATDEWETPDWLYSVLDREFGFTLDPCSTDRNAKCTFHFTRHDDGLIRDWGDNVVFMNPPYGRAIGEWMKKASEASRLGATAVCLVPARTDTKWWHQYAMKGEVRLLCGRIRFVGGSFSAPFPSAIVVFRPPAFKLKSDDLRGHDA